jgi:hypothetical protein
MIFYDSVITEEAVLRFPFSSASGHIHLNCWAIYLTMIHWFKTFGALGSAREPSPSAVSRFSG